MNLNWGKYLLIGMAGFMCFIVSMGIYMCAQNKDDYDHQYYEKGLNYDADYTREKQVYADKAHPKISLSVQKLTIKFASAAKGRMYFKRAANNKLDKVLPFEADDTDHTITIPTHQLASGPWHLRFEWESNLKQYLYEQEITLP